MILQKWDPIREFERVHEDLDRMLRNQWPQRYADAESTCTFAVDIHEDADAVRLRAELPGVKASDVDVRVEDNVLTVKGDKKLEKEEKKGSYLRVERTYGHFSRSFTLPPYVDAEKIGAAYQDGVLILTLPKKPETRPRQIEVKVS
jgi:HSP20 family protein